MNCSKCFVNYNKDIKAICLDIFEMFNILEIPLHEQVILWDIALKNINCRAFKDLLCKLVKRAC